MKRVSIMINSNTDEHNASYIRLLKVKFVRMKALFIPFLAAICFLVFSCSGGEEMLTRINPDGSCYREFVSNADSAFMVGDTARSNKFPVMLDSSWHVSWKYITPEIHTNWPLKTWKWDTAHKNESITIWAKRDFKSVKEMDTAFVLSKWHKWADIKAKHTLSKKFRWFYTYYSYTETYPKIKTLERIPFEKYMTKEEAEFWFNGKPDLLRGMNGIEIKDFLEKVEEKYNLWFGHNFWDMEYDVLLNHYHLLKNLKISKERLEQARDSIFEKSKDKIRILSDDFDFGKCMDAYFKTTAFSALYNQKDNPLKKFEDDFDDNNSFMRYFETGFDYKLLMPGKIMQTSNAVIQGDTLSWNLTAYRMVYSDYEISAQSRKANVWVFILSGLIAVLAVGSLFFKVK